MTEQQQNEINSVKILAIAAEGYLKSLDELGRNFVGPQVQAAIQIFDGIVAERNPAAAQAPTEAEAVPATGNADSGEEAAKK